MRLVSREVKTTICIIMLTLLTSCYQQKTLKYKTENCVIDSVYKRERSTIEIDNKYILETSCGKIGTKSQYEKGDTIKIYTYE